MVMLRRAVALWCAVALAATAAAYTVDCNHEYTDCDTELSKITGEEEDLPLPGLTTNVETTIPPSPPAPPKPTTPEQPKAPRSTTEVIESRTEETTTVIPEELKPKPRLLFSNSDDLQNFANALHNRTIPLDKKKDLGDLSDVNLDGDEDDEPVKMPGSVSKSINDKFFSNLQAPFHPMLVGEEDESEMCRENDVVYKVGERVDRGCEETCECTPGGVLECYPRCKHPYIRRGRRLNDPLCFESPVDECCSIIACATGNEGKPTKLEVCRYGNETFAIGAKWFIGCEQTCTCEKNSVVTCKPRCTPPPQSENCINVQDPDDSCCEIQVCDVSHDAHEEHENVTSTTSATDMINEVVKNKSEELHTKSTMRPLVLAEPIGSVKVLQNNTVQVNLIQANSSEDPIHLQLSSDGGKTFKDIELIYSNLILNLEGGRNYVIKTKETGTKFNFTITTTDNALTNLNEVPTEELHNITKIGCFQDGQFYEVGEEFHIGCTELCECTGPDTRECAALVCPSHVGLELMSKGCVRWAPSPPAEPPNCCPRAARCLSDGTCHYKGIPVPNWTEVPISLSGCEERCFCENGELDCQEACTPLPPLPPQTLRCPPQHRPAHVNISDEDCCKQWGCVPNAGTKNKTTYESLMKTFGEQINYVTPMTPILATITPVLAKPPDTTQSTDFYKHPNKIFPTVITSPNNMKTIPKYNTFDDKKQNIQNDNITIFTLDDPDSMIKVIQPEPSITRENTVIENDRSNCERKSMESNVEVNNPVVRTKINIPTNNFVLSDRRMHDLISPLKINQPPPHSHQLIHTSPSKVFKSVKQKHNQIGTYFIPAYEGIVGPTLLPSVEPSVSTPNVVHSSPAVQNFSINFHHTLSDPDDNSLLIIPLSNKPTDLFSPQAKLINTYRNKDLSSKASENDVSWQRDTKMHLLKNSPNPYQTVLLRQQTNTKLDNMALNENLKISPKPYSTLGVDSFLSQFDMPSEVNRNLGRSADKTSDDNTAGPMPANFPTHSSLPAFLPTVPPENFPNPQEDIPDYDQNNIHRPSLDRLPPGFPIPSSIGDDNKKLSVLSMQAESPTSVKMLFGLPPVLVGLRGSVDLRYTDQVDDDISHWYSQVFAPTDEVLTTPRLEFTLSGLKPATSYKIRGKLFLHNLPVEPESEIRVVRTLDPPTKTAPTEEKRREVDSRLTVMEVNDTVAHVSWRHFTEEELQMIDGIQVRYRPIGTPIYSMTELLHHGRSNAELHDLRPGTRYEASLVLVPPPRVVTELHDPGKVEFTTSPYVDPYNWTVTIEARAVGSEAAELTWRGVPSPAERWVRVYRAAHACGSTTPSTRREHDAFRLAARDLPPAVTLTGLEPNTRCRVWLELFLTNGKVKTSNVIEINTKSLDSPEPIDNEIESASIAAGSRTSPRGDYYGALVVVGVVAALGALTSLLLLLVVVKRHHTRSVAITPTPSAPRESSLPPYDNPAYKLELQQETMDL